MNFANKITLFRIISVPFFVACLVFYTPAKDYLRYLAMAIFLLAIVSDVVDGYIARRQRQKTQAGAILDPLADKALLLTAFIFLYRTSKTYLAVALPLWFLLIVISRDIIILVGSAILLATQKNTQITPTWWGKLTTFFQMATVIAVILEYPKAWVVWELAAVFTCISGIDYARKGINILNTEYGSTHAKTTTRTSG
ncbi:CDP-diacylglycerol--glycerol-3-phosphate 3-phosphatidyltransferase [Candidatus Velamenicoccus archaeovorus]|uniref:CDP-diacylglycerol--glycerol-3-phosphate 3-phosphatidyltransferase n=1 Tax=Velamenicoccus archaeovorus TaxID=1930593 RepID=A0A410P4C7_VELA1|nr:CDP-diacylglycerol--glycerol-3-phosphate 3-phosphatidyltransferase [Candidatus Velamenicoccus archaeovorus]QAT16931.1 CDP-diacylglycerol--glycerol-3-phosphate 3-phosphatidyltransferase [Candidatus Velamenicoccus archaeovorus]